MTNNYDAESRLRAIAMNAIREAMLVYQRWDKPFTDEDAARMHDIFLLLHLNDRNVEFEHAPLVTEKQPPIPTEILSIADLLEKRENEIAKSADSFPEAAAVKAHLPKAAQKPDR
jgi:hypothetical protein